MKKAQIYYARMDEFCRKEQKLSCLEKFESLQDVDWKEVKPDSKYTWLTEGSELDFEQFISIGNRSAKSSSEENQEVIFKLFSLGVSTNRDIWVRNFDVDVLANNIRKTIEAYNQQVSKWLNREDKAANVDGFVIYDDVGISWSSTLKNQLKRGTICKYTSDHVRKSIYRPFCSQFLYFNEILNDRRGQFPLIFPVPETEKENLTIWLKIGSEIPMYALAIKCIPDLLPQGGSQCFPFYIYDKDGTNRRENITDWALEKFQTHYQDPKITKRDIFHYTYALLHHPHYRQRYAANLKRELPRIPFAPEFHPFAISGKCLTEIHINYEQQPEYRLKHIENKDLPIDWRVEKMRLSKDKTQIKYNDFLTLTGIPPETFEYKLGNRSALDWIIDQYQVSTDKRSGITNDPNRLDEEEYIVRLIKQVITVSLETVKIVKGLPDLGLPKD
jgi:predicted helicase